jgi:hypothetical protein
LICIAIADAMAFLFSSLRKRALLCAGNFPEPTGPALKLERMDHGSRNATRAEIGPRAGGF